MKQRDIAEIFTQIADLLEFRGENVFRVRAYRRAAQSLEGFSGDLESAAADGSLTEIPGIGADLAEKICEYLKRGRVSFFEELTRSVPKGILEVLTVPGIGPRTAKILYEKLRISTLRQLETAAKGERIRKLAGFQATKELNIFKGIQLIKQGRERLSLGAALPLANELLAWLKKVPGVTRYSTAGSLRRMQETIGDLDLLVAARNPERVISAFTKAPFARRVLAAGTTKSSILTSDGIQVDLRVVGLNCFGAALQYFTGSKEHNVRLRELALRQGLKVNEYGVFRVKTNRRIAGRKEADVYRALKLPWIPPEMREDRGEIDAAKAGDLPRLVEIGDLKGDFHIHTNRTDGRACLEEMARSAALRGYQYIAICDHSRSLRIANGLSIAQLRRQMNEIRILNARSKRFQVLMGSEVDILNDGRMDYPDSLLSELDFVIGSIHSGFSQSETQITKRLIRAAENPYVSLIAHPTGRLKGQRRAYAVDLEAVFRASAKNNTAVEINAQPKRFDLTEANARRANEQGVMLALSTDSHSPDQFDNIHFGIGIARRAWIAPSHLLNCLSYRQLMEWIARKRPRRDKIGKGP